MIMADVNEGSLKEMEALVGEGVTSFKLFMAYPGVFYSDDGQVLRALQKGAETGGLIMMHAENGIAIDVLIEQALARGQTDPRYHGVVRHALLEAEATHRAIKLAQVAGRADLHRAPVGGARRSPRSRRPATRASTPSPRPARSTCSCPSTTWPGPASRAPSTSARRRCGPREHQAALWRGLRTDDLSVVSTDHCPFCFKGQKEHGARRLLQDPERAARRGDTGWTCCTRAWSTGTSRGGAGSRSPAPRPARMFGLYPRKGTIAPGSDADVVVYDPTATQVLSAATHHMNVDYSCYEGREITGKVEHGAVARPGDHRRRASTGARPGHGRFLRRDTCQYLR